ncbi:MAG: chemotaxis response regulator protein-glutamate methylesterase [Planctomycetes bacterium]|nr:chemotaxis response regulator protein-glutamate methylesterase [Planctomycetota bacterium]
MTQSTKVLLVDDSSIVRKLVKRELEQVDGIEVVIAENGRRGVEAVERDKPDIVVLDIEMPEMNGIEALGKIRAINRRLPVIMFSTLTERGASITLEALAAGANDYIAKPSGAANMQAALAEVRDALVARIDALCRRRPPRRHQPVVPVDVPARREPSGPIEIVAIASSTGGPAALTTVLPMLPADLPVPVVIVQHMPATFTSLLAKSLDTKCALNVREGIAGTDVRAGDVWIAPGGKHMELARSPEGSRLVTHEGPMEQSVRPAADVLFRSVAEIYGDRVLAVVLTGMGMDGRAGAEAIRSRGGHVFVQDEATSVVWGMPGAVVRSNLADRILPIDEIGNAITGFVCDAKPTAGRAR